jgi:MFS family permease
LRNGNNQLPCRLLNTQFSIPPIMSKSPIPLLALLAANAISMSGNAMATIAIPWFVLETTGSATDTALSGAAGAVPIVIAAVIGGVWVDRLGHQRASVYADIASGVTMALIPILYALGWLSFPVLLGLVFFGALLDAPGVAARGALVPGLAERAGWRLELVNSIHEVIESGSGLVGPLLAGLLIAALSAGNVLLVDAVSFGLSAGLVALLIPRMVESGKQKAGTATELTIEDTKGTENDEETMTSSSNPLSMVEREGTEIVGAGQARAEVSLQNLDPPLVGADEKGETGNEKREMGNGETDTHPLAPSKEGGQSTESVVSASRVPRPENETIDEDNLTVWKAFRAGVAYVWSNGPLRAIFGSAVLLNFLLAPVFGLLLPVYMREVARSPVGLGAVIAAFGGGSVLGAIVYGAWGHRWSRRVTFLVGVVAIGLGVVGVGLLLPIPVMVGSFFLAGLIAGPNGPLINTITQERTPANMRGRVLSIVNAMCFAGGPAGFLVAGALLPLIGLQPILLAAGALFAITGLVLAFDKGLLALG